MVILNTLPPTSLTGWTVSQESSISEKSSMLDYHEALHQWPHWKETIEYANRCRAQINTSGGAPLGSGILLGPDRLLIPLHLAKKHLHPRDLSVVFHVDGNAPLSFEIAEFMNYEKSTDYCIAQLKPQDGHHADHWVTIPPLRDARPDEELMLVHQRDGQPVFSLSKAGKENSSNPSFQMVFSDTSPGSSGGCYFTKHNKVVLMHLGKPKVKEVSHLIADGKKVIDKLVVSLNLMKHSSIFKRQSATPATPPKGSPQPLRQFSSHELIEQEGGKPPVSDYRFYDENLEGFNGDDGKRKYRVRYTELFMKGKFRTTQEGKESEYHQNERGIRIEMEERLDIKERSCNGEMWKKIEGSGCFYLGDPHPSGRYNNKGQATEFYIQVTDRFLKEQIEHQSFPQEIKAFGLDFNPIRLDQNTPVPENARDTPQLPGTRYYDENLKAYNDDDGTRKYRIHYKDIGLEEERSSKQDRGIQLVMEEQEVKGKRRTWKEIKGGAGSFRLGNPDICKSHKDYQISEFYKQVADKFFKEWIQQHKFPVQMRIYNMTFQPKLLELDQKV